MGVRAHVCVCVCVFHSSSVPCRRVGSSDVEDYSKTTGATRAALPSVTSACVFQCLLLCCDRDYLLFLPGQAGKPLLFFDFQLPRSLLHVGPEVHGSNTTLTCIQGTKYQVQCPCQNNPGSLLCETLANECEAKMSQPLYLPNDCVLEKHVADNCAVTDLEKSRTVVVFSFFKKKKADEDSESLCFTVWEKVFQHLGALPHKALKPDCCFDMVSSTFSNMQLVRGFHRLLKLTITSLDNNLHITIVK